MARRTRQLAAVLAMGLCLASCSGGTTPEAAAPSPGATVSPATPASAITPASPSAKISPGGAPSSIKVAPTGAAATSALRFPQAGTYRYDQSGFEEFCRVGASCDRLDLPATRTMTTTVATRTSAEAVLVIEGQTSRMRFIRDTMRFTRERALLAESYVRFSHEGIVFESTTRPAPPVEVLRFPLAVGARWAGSWEAETGGDYAIQVAGRESLLAGGLRRDVFRIVSLTTFRGEVEGRQDLTVWVDASTLATVKTAGSLDARSLFGRYRTAYETVLRSGPV